MCTGTDHSYKYLDSIVSAKGEGLMLRKPLSLYIPELTSSLLKVKVSFVSRFNLLYSDLMTRKLKCCQWWIWGSIVNSKSLKQKLISKAKWNEMHGQNSSKPIRVAPCGVNDNSQTRWCLFNRNTQGPSVLETQSKCLKYIEKGIILQINDDVHQL